MLRLIVIFFILLLFSCQEVQEKKIPPARPQVVQIQDSIITPPVEPITIDFDTSLWSEITLSEEGIVIDLKYATVDNFVNEKMYECGRCFLRPDVAKALEIAQHQLKRKGLGLKMFDCYRPRPVQQKLWNKVPNPSYVTPPKKGSMHNRGTAVDLTIVDGNGKQLDMGTKFDFFGKKAHHDCLDLPDKVLQNRKLLKNTMKRAGFLGIRTEWWHYYFAKGAPNGHDISDYEWPCEEL